MLDELEAVGDEVGRTRQGKGEVIGYLDVNTQSLEIVAKQYDLFHTSLPDQTRQIEFTVGRPFQQVQLFARLVVASGSEDAPQKGPSRQGSVVEHHQFQVAGGAKLFERFSRIGLSDQVKCEHAQR